MVLFITKMDQIGKDPTNQGPKPLFKCGIGIVCPLSQSSGDTTDTVIGFVR